jgi:hypothetical protein
MFEKEIFGGGVGGVFVGGGWLVGVCVGCVLRGVRDKWDSEEGKKMIKEEIWEVNVNEERAEKKAGKVEHTVGSHKSTAWSE